MACIATTHLYPLSKTDTTITVTWKPVDDAVGYQVEYKLDDPTVVTWSILPQQTSVQAVIGSLTPDTFYRIRVSTVCSSRTCTSVAIITKTAAFC